MKQATLSQSERLSTTADGTRAGVAVMIAAYNAEKTLERAVLSALAETETEEVFVIDDASTDTTAGVAGALAAADPRVQLITMPVNAGPAAARNAALARATADWVTILDADDYFLPGRLARLLAVRAGADLLADELLRTTGAAPAQTLLPLTHGRHCSFEAFLLGNLGRLDGPLDLGFVKPLLRRSFLSAHQLRYRDDLRLGEDFELYARALALGARFIVTAPAGYVSVEREGSLSKQHSEDDLEKLRDCDTSLRGLRAFSPSEERALRLRWTGVDCRLQWRRLISAVKNRDAGAAARTFHTPEAAMYLAARLCEQAWLRSARALGLR